MSNVHSTYFYNSSPIHFPSLCLKRDYASNPYLHISSFTLKNTTPLKSSYTNKPLNPTLCYFSDYFKTFSIKRDVKYSRPP